MDGAPYDKMLDRLSLDDVQDMVFGVRTLSQWEIRSDVWMFAGCET
ncbi:hypothetical protein [Candidatus Nitrospira allomarina]|uniref:Uncharacterized protein n=1 Tax=Candidatus Nitrospira allomarina TaxID=3020900 RepID=A0AA96GGB7_9BACT|nr:hypothetical protein [Candidatus Nitrospira allomarina]WNM58039.1 hypothetical protein PP769_19035 [Candidatus Nitrospira allomarina]